MKKFVMAKCMNYIKSNTNYDETKLKEIEYGLLGIYLTLSKLIIILLLSILLGVLKEVILPFNLEEK
jgi:accessory gene regulator protein AgrB